MFFRVACRGWRRRRPPSTPSTASCRRKPLAVFFSAPSALRQILNGRVEVRGLRRAHILDVMAALDVVSAGMKQLVAGGYPGPVQDQVLPPDVLAKAREELAALGGLVNIVLPPDPPASVRAKAA